MQNRNSKVENGTSASLEQNGLLGDVEYHLINKPDWIFDCIITVFSDGKILLNWNGRSTYNGLPIGENGFFLTMRAAKMYVTKTLSKGKSLWREVSANIA